MNTAPSSSTQRWQATLAALSLALLSVFVVLPLAAALLALWAGVLGLASAWTLDAIGVRERYVLEGAVAIAASLLGVTGSVALIGAVASGVRKLRSRRTTPPVLPRGLHYGPRIPTPPARTSWAEQVVRHPWLSLGGLALIVDGCVVPFQASRSVHLPPALLGSFVLSGATLLFLFAAVYSARGWWFWVRWLWSGVRQSAFFAGLVTAGSLAATLIALFIASALGQAASALSAQDTMRALEACSSGSTTKCTQQVVLGALGGKPRSPSPVFSEAPPTPEEKASFERCVEELHRQDSSGTSTHAWALREALRITRDNARAEDVVHGAILSVCLGSEDIQDLGPYFIRSVQNAASREWRRSRRYCPIVIDDPTWLPEACIAQSVEQRLLRAEMEASAHDALCQLDAQDRRILEWHIWDGFSHAEVGRRLGVSEVAARQRYSRALSALREKFLERCR